MAEGQGQEDRDTDDLSEEASPYRAEEMRRKGQVAQSREISGLAALVAAGAAVYALWPSMSGQILEFMRSTFTNINPKADIGNAETIQAIFMHCLKIGGTIVFPVTGIAFAMGAL